MMATKVVMEALSPTMEEGRLVEWKKNEGDAVAVGDVLAEVETDKAVMELVARAAGTLIKQAVAAGSDGSGRRDGGVDRRGGRSGARRRGAGTARRAASSAAAAQPATPTGCRRDAVPARAGAGRRRQRRRRRRARRRASRPRRSRRRIAADKGVDLNGVAGSGPEGRIIKRDVEQVSAAPARRAASRCTAGAAFTDVPLSQMRKTIAKRLVAVDRTDSDLLPHRRSRHGARARSARGAPGAWTTRASSRSTTS